MMAFCTLLVSCVHVRPPAQSGARWHELVSPHFILQTGVSVLEARETIDQLEHAHRCQCKQSDGVKHACYNHS